jgi:hypothetical protein
LDSTSSGDLISRGLTCLPRATIPNRGFTVDDIELFGLTYVQKVTDTATGGALHNDPGIWIWWPVVLTSIRPVGVAVGGAAA